MHCTLFTLSLSSQYVCTFRKTLSSQSRFISSSKHKAVLLQKKYALPFNLHTFLSDTTLISNNDIWQVRVWWWCYVPHCYCWVNETRNVSTSDLRQLFHIIQMYQWKQRIPAETMPSQHWQRTAYTDDGNMKPHQSSRIIIIIIESNNNHWQLYHIPHPKGICQLLNYFVLLHFV